MPGAATPAATGHWRRAAVRGLHRAARRELPWVALWRQCRARPRAGEYWGRILHRAARRELPLVALWPQCRARPPAAWSEPAPAPPGTAAWWIVPTSSLPTAAAALGGPASGHFRQRFPTSGPTSALCVCRPTRSSCCASKSRLSATPSCARAPCQPPHWSSRSPQASGALALCCCLAPSPSCSLCPSCPCAPSSPSSPS